MNEKLIERKLKERVKKMGGLAIKFASPFFTGMPDRLIFLPGNRIRLVELKSTKKTLSDRQKIVRGQLEKMQIPVTVIDSEELLQEFFKELNYAV